MTESRSKIKVEVVTDNYINSLTLSEKDTLPQDNSFFIQLSYSSSGHFQLAVSVDKSEYSATTITKKEFNLLQDNIREILDTPGKAGIINLNGNKIQILHFNNGEIGWGIGKGKYLLESDDAALLKEFCVKLM